MATDKRVQILLSTYNGAQWLREQLESIFRQTVKDRMELLVRDDGSTDDTKDILSEYARLDQNIQVVFGENIGANASYQWLMEHSNQSCAYFAFCDQDDVWLDNKMKWALDALDATEQKTPRLYASSSLIVDNELRKFSRQIKGENYRVSYYNAMIQNILPGHTQVMNRAMLDCLLAHGFQDVHVIDWWSYLAASGSGEIIYDPRCTVLHRQHGNNAVGFKTGILPQLLRRISYIREGRANAFSRQLNAFYHFYKDELPDEYRKETEAFLASLGSLSSRIAYAAGSKAFRQKRADTFMFKLLYIIGKYNL